MPSNNNEQFFIGIDGGGSKCKAVVMDANNTVLGTGISGPGNPYHGFEQATNSIIESATLALHDANLADIPLSSVIVGAGLAGVNLPILYNKMSSWSHPFKSMHLATDLLIACLGAHKGEDGAVIITGTGSCGFTNVNDKTLMLGAHGFPHGDKGSGAWFGLQAVKQVLLALDKIIPPTSMTAPLLARFDSNNATALVEAVAGKPATFYAKLANLVFDEAERGDDTAKAIVLDGCGYINRVAQRLWQQNPPRMSIIGGLAFRVVPWLQTEIANRLSAPLAPPEVGAVLFAKQQIALTDIATTSLN